MMTHDEIMQSRLALEEFAQNNPHIFQEDGSVKFAARLTWKVSDKPPRTEDGFLVRWNTLSDCSGIVVIEQPDGFGDWEQFWIFHYEINHRCKYDSGTNTLSIMDKREYVEVVIEYDLSVLEILSIQNKLN